MSVKKNFSYCLILVLALVYSPASGQQKLQKVRFGVPSRSITIFPLIAAKKQGFDRQEGLDFQVIIVRPTITTQALLAGELDFSSLFTRSTTAAVGGAPVRLVLSLSKGPNHVLVVKPEIKTMKHLKGKVIGIDGPKQILEAFMLAAFKKYGLSRGDVKLLGLGGGGSRTRRTALLTGRIDGTLLTPPDSVLTVNRHGYRILFAAREVSGIPGTALGTTISKIKNDPEMIVGTAKAALKGIRFLKKNKAAFLELLVEEAGVKDKKTADQIYDAYLAGSPESAIAPDAAIMEAITLIKNLRGTTEKVTVADVADWSLAKRAMKELK